MHGEKTVVNDGCELALEGTQGRAMVFALGALAFVVDFAGVTCGARLNESNRMKASIKLAISASIHANRRRPPARAGNRCRSGSHRKCRGVTVVAQVASVADDSGGGHNRHTAHSQELRSQTSDERAQVPRDRVDALVKSANLCARIEDLVR